MSSLPSSFVVTLMSRKGRDPPCSISIVNFMVGCMLFRWCRSPSTSPFLRMNHVSPTYCFCNLGLEGADSRASSSATEKSLHWYSGSVSCQHQLFSATERQDFPLSVWFETVHEIATNNHQCRYCMFYMWHCSYMIWHVYVHLVPCETKVKVVCWSLFEAFPLIAGPLHKLVFIMATTRRSYHIFATESEVGFMTNKLWKHFFYYWISCTFHDEQSMEFGSNGSAM